MAKITSENALTAFAAWLQEQDRAGLTVRAYTTALAACAAWFEQRTGQPLTPAALTPLDVRTYRQHLTEQGCAPATVNKALAALRAYARWGKATGQATHDPVNGVKPVQQVAAAPKWLSRPEQLRLLRQAQAEVQQGEQRAGGDPHAPGGVWPRRDAALLGVLLNTGLRLAEVAALTVGDVTVGERAGHVVVRQGKGNKQRTVPLNQSARVALKGWLQVYPGAIEAGAPLWVSQKGGALSARAIGLQISGLAQRAGLQEVSPHTLRHTFAKNLVDSGVGLEKVATLLGHSQLETTRRYVTPSQADLQAATERVSWEE